MDGQVEISSPDAQNSNYLLVYQARINYYSRFTLLFLLSFYTAFLPSILTPTFADTIPQNAPPLFSLSDFVNLVLKVNPASVSALEAETQAEDALKEAQAQRHFQLSFTSSGGASNAAVIQPPPSKETFGQIQNTLTVPIPVGSKPDVEVDEAEQLLSAAKASYLSAELDLAKKAVSAYFDYLMKQAAVTNARSDLDSSNRDLSDAQKRFRAGDIPELDVEQAQVPVATDQAALVDAQSDASIALETVNDLIDQPLDQPISLTDWTDPPDAPSYSVVTARTMAVAASPDLASVEATVRSDEAAFEAAKHYNDPAISLQAIDLRSGDQTSFSREDSLLAAVTLPLDDGGFGKATLAQTASALDAAKAEAESTRKAVISAVSSDYLKAQNGVAEVNAALVARDFAESTYQKTLAGYENGLYPVVDTLTAQKELSEAKTAYVQALYTAAESTTVLNADVYGIESLTSPTLTTH